MLHLRCVLGLWFLNVVVVEGGFLESCRGRLFNLNVVLLEDDVSMWSLKYVREAVYSAINKDKLRNEAAGLTYTIRPNFCGFNTTLYRKRGCPSSSCEGVEILKSLHDNKTVGCAMLGPSCTYATFQLVDQNVGFTLSIPIISAGSFGLSCDDKPNLTRLLPPAHKVSSFFQHFWNVTGNHIKRHEWETAYVFKREDNSEECFWYINAMEAATHQFAKQIKREILRSLTELQDKLGNDASRHSNIFILCGTPKEIAAAKNVAFDIHPDIVFILIDIFNPHYHSNSTALPYMKNVLVLTHPNTRNYSGVDWSNNNSMINDYVAGYHDGVLLFGHVIRQELMQNRSRNGPSSAQPLFTNPFRNVAFDGLGGRYELDEKGDRDVHFSLIYTSNTDAKYKILFEFNSATNHVELVDINPDLIWPKSRLPDDKPANGLEPQQIIMIVLGLSVVIVTGIALIFYRQNRMERRNQKKWSHIQSELIAQLDDKERSLISLRIDGEHKDSGNQIRKGRYDKKPVILKELDHTDD
ncbi:heat-stable enterotoxin receptor-like [Clupea harengus]|uniref:Heat-stable enterotoxin receptor-like n=1 Tax=Clupea harengus TaxID=7950 RepID=A0A6P8G076_CLUHA|nr:heat-stable enterotoxin receptor-like [Clupea harengus]